MTLAVAMKRRNSKREGRMELHVNRGCHVNNLIRLASLCDSPHKTSNQFYAKQFTSLKDSGVNYCL